MSTEREFDVVLWGATGFTGQLAAAYLAQHQDARGLSWALGGRDLSKLEVLRGRLAQIEPCLATLPLVQGDARSTESMAELASRTRVVASLVGPYAYYGSALVQACAEHGTHYCDLTGEVPWIRRMIDQHHERARETGARIVHCCGLDSIPSDLGMWILQEYARENFGSRCDRVSYLMSGKGLRMSGGTVESGVNIVDEASQDPALRRLLADPYGLDPSDARGTAPRTERLVPSFDHERGVWTAPFVMAGVNTRIVRRTNALLGHPYGRAVRYEERVRSGRGPLGLFRAATVTGALGFFPLAVRNPVLRGLLKRFVLPRPGEGPSEEVRRRARFAVDFHGRSEDGTLVLRGKVTMPGEPAYDETSKMLVESALCLARDVLHSEGGVLTPAAAMAEPLLARLRAAGHHYEVEVERASPERLVEHTRRQQAAQLSN